MWVVCLRYTRNRMVAEDVMQEGFIRAFEMIGQYSGAGSLEGWLRKIFVRTAINHFRKYYQNAFIERDIDTVFNVGDDNRETVLEKMSADHLLEILDTLPPGYKMVFNLYAIEGYNHREIAEMLGCSEGNSKSQLARARAHLQKIVNRFSDGTLQNTKDKTEKEIMGHEYGQ